jgi:hypothetical protein
MAKQEQRKPFGDTQGGPNILVIIGDDIGWFNISSCNMGSFGNRMPNIDPPRAQVASFTISDALEKIETASPNQN